jgi:hypothetical protein
MLAFLKLFGAEGSREDHFHAMPDNALVRAAIRDAVAQPPAKK